MQLSLFLLALPVIAAGSGAVGGDEDVVAISVIFNSATDNYDVVHVADDSYDAYGYYHRNFNASGWNFLDINMQTEIDSPADQLSYSKAIGFLEGYVSCDTVRQFWPNYYSDQFGNSKPGVQTVAFLQANYRWMVDMAEKNMATDDYWFTVKSITRQLEGLYEGYVAGCGTDDAKKRIANSKERISATELPPSIFATLDHPTLEHFLMINAWGDLYQIAMKYEEPAMATRLQGGRRNQKVSDMVSPTSTTGGAPPRESSKENAVIERCSAIIKLLADRSDVVYGHGTWDSFEALAPRILKHYSMPLVRGGSEGGHAEHHYDVYFSSSPALLSSVDDFFTVSGYAQLGVQETTNNLYNFDLLDQVVPASSLSWMRAQTSNQMASSGADWGTQFARYQSGTYTNQWMVLDLKLFSPGTEPQPGFLTVLEEVPGLVHVEDQTQQLVRDGYWASYNIPFYQDISDASGYTALCARDATRCHDTAPRAYLFAQYQEQVVDVASGQWLMGYNSFQNDTASLNDSCNAIACRGDLEPNPLAQGAFGALDAKVTTATGSRRENGQAPELFARMGPTHDQQPPFCWSNVADEADYSHVAQPECFEFDWQLFPPAKPSPA